MNLRDKLAVRRAFQMTNRMRKWIRRALILILIVLLGWLGYRWTMSQPALSPVKTVPKQLFGQTKTYSQADRQKIAGIIAAQDQTANSLTKQGFVAIPKLSILLPIYDNAYSAKALNLGANTAQKGTPVPTMGQGNYTLAAHNWDNGYTAFSALQQKLKQNAPYYANGQFGSSDWLNGQTIYLANGDGVFRYQITGQDGVSQDDVSVLNPNARDEDKAKLTIVTCLFPDTTKRIITNAKFVGFDDWADASNAEVSYFDTKSQKINLAP